MEFIAELIQTAIEMLVIAAVALGGIRLGKALRDRKDAKQKSQADTES